jgi:hypothetical protein
MAYSPRVVDNEEIRAGRISLNQKFTIPIAERLGNYLACLRMYGWLSLARSHACAGYTVAVNVPHAPHGRAKPARSKKRV